jgi:hypothetical protein
MKGIFYNSKQSVCSIWESGKMCYDALSKSVNYTLDYSEAEFLDTNYDFAIFNHHPTVNNWITESLVKSYNKPTFCVVTEVTFNEDVIYFSPKFFSDYIVLDPTINETNHIHAFGRPLEDFHITNDLDTNSIPNIFSFGFATHGKEWHKIVEIVHNEFDNAIIHFNIPKATYVPQDMHDNIINSIYIQCYHIIKKKGIQLKITHDNLSKEELITLCSKQTINCFYYNRQHLFASGLAAVTDQAISSGRPILVTGDRTFRHIHKYINYFPNISIKEAIQTTQSGVLLMKSDWSSTNFLLKFEKILFARNKIFIPVKI